MYEVREYVETMNDAHKLWKVRLADGIDEPFVSFDVDNRKNSVSWYVVWSIEDEDRLPAIWRRPNADISYLYGACQHKPARPETYAPVMGC